MTILLMFSIASAELRFKCTADSESNLYIAYYFTISSNGLSDGTKTVMLSGNNNMDGAEPYIWNGVTSKDGSFYKSPHNDTTLTFNGDILGAEPVLNYTSFQKTVKYNCLELSPSE